MICQLKVYNSQSALDNQNQADTNKVKNEWNQ